MIRAAQHRFPEPEMNGSHAPFVIDHSHSAFICLPSRKARVIKEPSSNSKNRESQRNESRVDSRCTGVVCIVHQSVILLQERRLVHHGKQEVEPGEISFNLFPMVRSGDIIEVIWYKGDGRRKNFT